MPKKSKVIKPTEVDIDKVLDHLHSPAKIEPDASILNSPAITNKATIEEVSASATISRIVNDITFLRNRMIKDYTQVQLYVHELMKMIPNMGRADYYFSEGLESINQALEYLKDYEEGDK